jgi:aspartyl-tRNA synthetase
VSAFEGGGAADAGRAPWKRTHTCGELRKANVGQVVTLNGWVSARRDHGRIYFVDLRDRYGLTQVVLSEDLSEATRLGPEFVISITGEVVSRSEENVNPDRATGEIEVAVRSLEVLADSRTPPFEVLDEIETAVETRLRYRYVDLRRPVMQRNMIHRSQFIHAMRSAFQAQGFVEIETPVLTKATPEGARDYLVPSRVNPGKFYALPQSPQIFKQILMVSGYDRYFQVARCFRDEDLRADRQPDFTQLDMEMSFVEENDVWAAWERALADTFREAMGVEIATPFPRMPYAEAMERFGSDKPDVRFGLELVDAGSWAQESEFQVFRGTVESGGRVMGIVVPGGASLTRKELAAIEAVAVENGARGLAWWKAGSDGGAGPLARFCADGRAASLMELLGAAEGDLAVFVADRQKTVHKALSAVRLALGRKLGLLPPGGVEGGFAFLWVTEFPMFEQDEETEKWVSLHHPFTAPSDWDLAGDLGTMASRAYDLVLNGWELGSGSIRIHRRDTQRRVFELLGLDEEEQQSKFGFLLEALEHGAPPHGGFALGLDRTVALTLGLENIRDTIAFPKTASAADLLCDAPSRVSERQLEEIHVRLAGRAIAVDPQPGASQSGDSQPGEPAAGESDRGAS